ncbi:hypothetical protein K474DRAFT_1594131, partial [Panus rudis PR-1116 ss-1]
CLQCLATVKKKDARRHTGGHILRAMRGVPEPLKGEPINVSRFPCGFCSRTGSEECTVYLTNSKTPKTISNCPLYTEYYYKASLVSTQTGPCTNAPIVCKIVNCTALAGKSYKAVWKYNMEEHI